MRYDQSIAVAAQRLAAAGIEQSRLDARLLMQHASGFTHAELIAHMADAPGRQVSDGFAAAVERRLAGEPVHRIIGRREFYGLELTVSPAVLDPRPETEILVARVLNDHADRNEPLYFADVGTGSGAIAIALLANLAESRCLAIDISGDALSIARENACAHGLEARMELVAGNYLKGVDGNFDFIVSNPPYVRSGEIGGLAREVRNHDPHVALDGGADGLVAYRALMRDAAPLLNPSGRLYLEIGEDQAGDCSKLAGTMGWQVTDVVADLAGKDRVLVVSRS